MELASAPLNPYYAVSPVRYSAAASRILFPSLPNFRATVPRISSSRLASISTGFILACEKVRFHSSCIAACVGNTTAAMTESDQEHMPLGTKPNPEANDEAFKEDDKDREAKNSEQLDDDKMLRVCDKLIEVFMVDKPTSSDWRKLITFSKTWDDIRPQFFKRCQDRADSESDPGMKVNLLRLARKLKEVDDDIQRHNELLGVIRKSPSEVDEIVERRRKDFTQEFFDHLKNVAQSYYDNPTEQKALVKLGETCLAAVEAYDTETENIEAPNSAEFKLQDIMNSHSVDFASRKIDNLADKNRLDPAMAHMFAKAWSGAKGTDMTKDEVKDMLYHQYKTAAGNLQRLVPKEIRILKYLLTIEDPLERMTALTDAFTPGLELEGEQVDCLYTTPQQLHALIKNVLGAYNNSREGTVLREARDLVNPRIIPKMEELRKIIENNFM
ncbi:hypothetical protein CDL12_23648 [Handroanthus impetiginosus]|uniref:Uncharacterized protein n=1 Tax=Handroanthus impetiginosus TaxID=429701 RepID=A0A2G9GEW5_9LAMI|nr:hypothetical protein CDL12_23648 [Handroanthus impetiginosus]